MDLNDAINQLVYISDTLQRDPSKTQQFLPALQRIHELLNYHSTPKPFWQPDEKIFSAVGMSCNKCSKSWNTPDACLLNFNGIWLCREHHPPLSDGGVRPAGYSQPIADQEKLDKARKEVFLKLSVAERKLINSRIV